MHRRAVILFALTSSPAWSCAHELSSLLNPAERTRLTWHSFRQSEARKLIQHNTLPNGSVMAATGDARNEYKYHWVRDGALVMDVRLDQFTKSLAEDLAGAPNPQSTWRKDLQALAAYLKLSELHQLTPSPKPSPNSQLLYDGNGKIVKEINFGEAKFQLDGSSFDESWGRPQNDGPALRALTLLNFYQELKKVRTNPEIRGFLGNQQSVDELLRRIFTANSFNAANYKDSVVRRDLDFIVDHWREPSFDLWEESRGTHFYTRMVQWRALDEGAKTAHAEGHADLSRWYQNVANEIAIDLQKFFDPGRGFIAQTRDRNGGIDYKQGLDSATILALLHTTDSESGQSLLNAPFKMSDSRVLATVAKLENSFSHIYPFNKNFPIAPAMGRYPEDRYYGGNPWVLITYSFSDYYKRLAEFYKSNDIIFDEHNEIFFERLIREQNLNIILPQSGTLSRHSSKAKELQIALSKKSQAFYDVIAKLPGNQSELAEQFDRNTGTWIGAENLTWNAAAYLRSQKYSF